VQPTMNALLHAQFAALDTKLLQSTEPGGGAQPFNAGGCVLGAAGQCVSSTKVALAAFANPAVSTVSNNRPTVDFSLSNRGCSSLAFGGSMRSRMLSINSSASSSAFAAGASRKRFAQPVKPSACGWFVSEWHHLRRGGEIRPQLGLVCRVET